MYFQINMCVKLIQTRSKIKINSVFIKHTYVSLCVADARAQLCKVCILSRVEVDPSNYTTMVFRPVICTNWSYFSGNRLALIQYHCTVILLHA